MDTQTSFMLHSGSKTLRTKPWTIMLAVFILLGLAILPVAATEQPIAPIGQPEAIAPISTSSNDQYMPRLAFGSQSNEYLVVWEEVVRDYDYDIYAVRVNNTGVPNGWEIEVATSGNMETHPSVAYSTSTHKFLVVWEYEYSFTDHDILGQMVNADGSLDGGVIQVANLSYNFDMKPTVTYNPTAQEFLVVFERRMGSDEFFQQDIYAQRVHEGGYNNGGEIAIAISSLDEQNPSVANDGTDYLVVWQGDYSLETNIYGQRISGSGLPISDQFAIVTWEGDQLVPQIMYNADDQQYFVVWEDHHFNPWEIYGYRLDQTGFWVGSQVSISVGGSNNRTDPDVTYLSRLRSYIVVWQYEYSATDHDIYSRRVAYNGSHPEAEYPVSALGAEEKHPALAGDGLELRLVAWEDWRNYGTSDPPTGVDIYGSMEAISVPTFTGGVYDGNTGDFRLPIEGVSVELGCSNDYGMFGDLLDATTTNRQGTYQLFATIYCEYYNLRETNLDGYYSIASQSGGGEVISSDWIYYIHPLGGKALFDNNFWDKVKPPVDNSPPSNWNNFYPQNWINTQTVNSSVRVEDTYSGLAVGSATYSFSRDGGISWSEWKPAQCTGEDGTKLPQTISTSVSFGQDSNPAGKNLVRFGIDDMVGNHGQSPAYLINIDTMSPLKPSSLECPSHPTSVWKTSNIVSCQWSGASDALSGVGGYTVLWDHNVTSLPGLNGSFNDTNVTSGPLSDGEWYFHVRTIDNAGNGSDEAKFYGPIRIDTMLPEAWITSPSPGSVNSRQVNVSWTGIDSPSGINTYDVQRSVNGGVWENWYPGTPNTSAILTGERGQTVSLRVRARDYAGNLGNWSSMVTIDFGVMVNAIVKNESGIPLPNADVYFNGVIQGKTNSNGTLNIYGVLIGDEIAARYLITTSPAHKLMHHWIYGPSDWAYHTYLTSLSFDNTGAPLRFLVSNTNTQQVLVVKKTNTLIGFNILVSVEWDADQSYLNDLETAFQKASAYLFDVTDGQMYFEAVDIWDNKSYWDLADYQILAQNGYRANASLGGIWNGTDFHVYMGRGYPWAANMFDTLIHEFGHYGFKLYDEYMDRNGKESVTQCTIDRIKGSPDAENASFMDNQHATTEMCSNLNTHPHNPNTMQDEKNGGPCWNTVYDNYRDQANPPRWIIIRPDDRGSIMAGPVSIPESGWSVMRTNGFPTNACNPIDIALNYEDGSPGIDFDVWVKGGLRNIYQGKTYPDVYLNPTTGLMTILGAYPGDTVSMNKSCGWFCSYSSSFIASCSAQSISLSATIKRDPFAIEVSGQAGGDGKTLQIEVVSSITLPTPPSVQIIQGDAAIISPTLIFNGSDYTGNAILDPELPLIGRIIAQASDAQGHTVFNTKEFRMTQVDSADLSWMMSADGKAEVFLPAGSLEGNPYMTIQPTNPISLTQESLQVVGKSYSISVSSGAIALNIPGTLNIYLSQEEISGLNPSSVGLYRWDDLSMRWIRIEANVDWQLPSVSASISELGIYAILAEEKNNVYLPVINK